MYEDSLKYLCQWYSNNSKPRFSDEEILTIHLFVGDEFGITAVKGASVCLRQMDKAANNLFNRAVSSVRDSIEVLFSWLNEKTGVQRTSLCRSTSELLIHIMGKLAIAFIPHVLTHNFNY